MTIPQGGWSQWVKVLQQWGLQDIAAELLDAAGPVQVVLAQVIYLSRPALEPFLSTERLDAVAALLEDHDASRAFAAYLREESQP